MKFQSFRIRIFVLIGVLVLAVSSVYAETAKEYFNHGVAYSKQGNWPQAISDFTKAIEINPNFPEAYYNRGTAYFHKGSYDQAILDLTKAIELNPNFAYAYNGRGVAYGFKGSYNQAISDYTKAVGLNPSFAYAYKNRASAYYHKQEYDKAWVDVRKTEELGEKVNREFIEELKKASGKEQGIGNDKQVSHDNDSVFIIHDKASTSVFIASNQAENYCQKGVFDKTMGNYDQAILDYTKAIEIDPKYAIAYNFRGAAYSHQGNFSQAISDLNKAIEINPKDAYAYFNRGLAYYREKEYDKAWADVHKAKGLGFAVDTEFLTKLKKASGRDK
jgi:lipoprotein NlpI